MSPKHRHPWERPPPADPAATDALWLASDPKDPRLTQVIDGQDERGEAVSLAVVREQPLTLFRNEREIVTAMTIGDHPEYLALGYLANQNLLGDPSLVSEVEHDAELDVVVVRTTAPLSAIADGRQIRTSGCAEGTTFEAFMEEIQAVRLPDGPRLKTSALYKLLHETNRMPSLYLEAGAIHGCVLAEGAKPLVFFEDVGRHNAVDKIAGYMTRHEIDGRDKVLYTTGRLTSEMVLKAVKMGVPIVASRSGFTARGAELAQRANLTLLGRARGERFTVLSGDARLERDVAVRARRGEVAS